MSDLLLNTTTNPGTPASAKAKFWASSANKRLWFTDENGVAGQVGTPYTTYYVDDYGVSPSNTDVANVAAMNTLLQTTAPNKSKIQFGSGTYQFNAGLTSLTKDFAFAGIRGATTIAITGDMGASTPFINCNNTGFYTSFRDLNFVNFHSQTTNMVIACRNNANLLIEHCFFTGASNWVDVLTFSGTNSGNGAVLKNVYIANWTGKAINVSSPLDTMYIEDLEIVGTFLAGSSGFYCDNGGALMMSNCQIIGADINVELIPANGNTVSAVFAINCFFDQGRTNCMLISGAGTGTVARCHFNDCWFTISAGGANTNCIQVTTAGTGIHAGIEFQDCWIMNATPGSTGTINGLVVTSAQDFSATGCQFAGWTNDLTVTPASAGTCAPLIANNTMASAGLIAASANNIVLNAGSFTYGNINIQGNTLNGGTSKITDNAAAATGAAKVVANNVGMANVGLGASIAAAAQALAVAANLVTGTSISLPTNGLRVGSRFRWDLAITKTAAGAATWAAALKFGTANGTGDAAIATWTSGTNTALADIASLTIFMEVLTLGAAATAKFFAVYVNAYGTAVTGLGSLPIAAATAAFNSTSANPFLHVDITPGAAAVMTAAGSGMCFG